MRNFFSLFILFITSIQCLGQSVNIKELQEQMKQHDVLSMLRLAQCYEYGFTIQKDSMKAISVYNQVVKLCEDSANKGDLEAQLNLGRALPYLKTHEDSVRAFKWTLKAAEQGNLAAMNNISIYYFIGNVSEKNINKGMKYLQEAAIGGYDISQFRLGDIFFYGLPGIGKDYDKSIYWYRQAACQGFIQAEVRLGYCYFAGLGVSKDYEKANDWWKKAIIQYETNPNYFHGYNLGIYLHAERISIGNAYYYLGNNYDKGFGCITNNTKAAEYYQKSVDLGNVNAMNNLAVMYITGIGVEKSPSKAVELYEKAAELGNIYAQTNLADMYLEGTAVEHNEHKALFWYKRAASKDSVLGQRCLGNYYLNKSDTLKAIECYRIAAEHNDTVSLYNLGTFYYYGLGVVRDYKYAFSLFQKAAEHDYGLALQMLAECYYNGNGIDKDLEKAAEYYRRASERGLFYSQFRLGMCYFNGEGVPKDNEKAAFFMKKSANEGFSSAQYILGLMYNIGIGVPKDKRKAKYWLQKAAEGGETLAIRKLKEISSNDNMNQ